MTFHIVTANDLDGILEATGTDHIAYVNEGILVSKLGDVTTAGILFSEGGSDVFVHGHVFGTGGVSCGTETSTESSHVFIGNTGDVTGVNVGVVLQGDSSSLNNAGEIHGGEIGAFLLGSGITVFNSGLIEGDGGGLLVRSSAGTPSYVQNTGTIKGLEASIGTTDGFDTVINGGTLVGSLSTNSGNDLVRNGGGVILGSVLLGNGSDVFYGADGLVTGTVYGGGGSDSIFGGAADEILAGDAGNDTLNGGAGNDLINGGDNADVLTGGAGEDVLSGGTGSDTASYATSSWGVTLALDGSFEATGDAALDTLLLIENLLGSRKADTLRGDAAANILNGIGGDDTLQGLDGGDFLFGVAGNDTLAGGAGDDVLNGGVGADTLSGGAGNDLIDYTSVTQGGDTLQGFSSNAAGNDDTLRFKGSAFGGLPAGALAAGQFIANLSGAAQTANQHFIYETDTGILRYDADASGSGAAVVIATLNGAPELALSDFMIF